MLDVTNRSDVQKALESAQESDRDMRDIVKEVEVFLHKKDGQWEQGIINQRGATRPRYTFDMCNPIVDQVSGPLQRSDFAIKVRPSGGDASKDIAKTHAGLVRNTENLSKAKTLVYNVAIKKIVATGLAGWKIEQAFADPKSFDQDLIIKPITNVRETVWLDEHSLMQDGSDSKMGWELIPMSRDEYTTKWPDGSRLSVGQNQNSTVYTEKPEFITVAQYFYLKAKKTTLVKLSNGRVYDQDSEEYDKVKDDLARLGVTEDGTREAEIMTCFQRIYDGSDWLTEEEETVFDGIPLILAYGNYDIIENKKVYSGEIVHLMDSQRVLNYAETKKVEETALSPKSKIAASAKQYAAYKTSWETMNTNNEPVLPWDHDPENPNPPFRIEGGLVNPGLESVSANMRANIQASSGMFGPQMGDNPFQQSGKALEIQVDQGNEGKEDYFNALVIAYERTAQLLINAYPKIYDTKRQVRLLNQDGTFDMVTLHDTIQDEQTGEQVSILDLSQGIYDVTYDVGPGYKNQQQETIDAFLRMGEVDPSFIQQGKDIMVNQLNAPGMSDMHERVREQMVMSGAIPQEQLTDEESARIQQIQESQQNQPPSPEEMIGQAEMTKANTEAQTAQFNQQVKQAELQLENIKLQQSQQKLDQEAAKIDLSAQSAQIDAMFKANKQNSDLLTDAVNQMKTITEAFGIEALAGSAPANLVDQQGRIIDEKQDNIN